MSNERLSYSVSAINQNSFTFYTCSMPSDVLAECSFVSTREEDPKVGFQRLLNKNRAKEIADYIDTGFGTIPNAIILSAQSQANVKIDRRKSIQFDKNPHAFLILDGQHRVYGFSLAKKSMRVPVVIYVNLTRVQESRLFIDINTKQKQVPKELLLDIKSLAEIETDEEEILRELFDVFNNENNSQLFGLMHSSKTEKGKINRVTFNNNVRYALNVFGKHDSYNIYKILNEYLAAFISGMDGIRGHGLIINKTVFGASMRLFQSVARRYRDRFGADFNSDNFSEILKPIFDSGNNSIKISTLKNAKGTAKLANILEDMLDRGFTI